MYKFKFINGQNGIVENSKTVNVPVILDQNEAVQKKRDNFLLLLLISFFIIWKLALMLDFRYAGNGDGPWWLSQTYSWLRGNFFEAPFGFSHISPFLNPYMYAVITTPFFALKIPQEISLQIYCAIWQIVALFLAYRILKSHRANPSSMIIILMSIVTVPYYYSLREEVPIITLLLLVVYILEQRHLAKKKSPFILIAFLSAFIGIIHPVGGVFSVTLVVLFLFTHSYKLSDYLKYFVFLFFFILVMYGPIIFVDFNSWRNSFFNSSVRNEHRFKLLTFIKFVSINPFLFFPYISVVLFTAKNVRILVREVIYFFFVVVIIAIFGKSYYFPYLIVFFVWRLTELPSIKFPNFVVIACIFIFPILSHYLPTFQQLENRAYVNQANLNLSTVDSYSSTAETNYVWVPPYIGMPIIDKEGSRAHHSCSLQSEILLNAGDIILVDTLDGLNCLLDRYIANPSSELVVTEIYPEVPGLLSISSLFQDRSDGVGLWEIRLKE
jgi:hypothetical protein